MHTASESKVVIFHKKELATALPKLMSEGWTVRATSDASGLRGYEEGAQQVTFEKEHPLPTEDDVS